MSENNIPASKPDPEVSPGEFDFAKPVEESPRMKRRSLKAKIKPEDSLTPANGAPPAARELAHEAPVVAAEAAKPEYKSDSRDDADAGANNAVKMREPSQPSRPTYASTAKPSQPASARPSTTTSTPTTSPHGTRPATLYYSTGPRKEPEKTPPMKSTPAASPAPATPASSTSPARSTAASVRPTTVVDYRTNVDRQAREQKSVGGILSILVYTLIGLFVVAVGLAGYGGYVLSKQIQQQSVTVSDLDKHYAQANLDLNAKLAATQDTLTQAQAQINRQQELIVKQQETINRLLSAIQDNTAAIRTERSTRAEETASIRTRLKNLEYRGPTTQKY